MPLTTNKWSTPNKEITLADISFGPRNLRDFLPSMEEIPAEFQKFTGPWQDFVSDWFFNGLGSKQLPTNKQGINQRQALAHIKVILASFEPKHEHKIAGCAYLMSLWFEPLEKTK